jgi:hypothetical protein
MSLTAEISERRSIAQLGIMTAERPALLKRALESYIANLRDREMEFVVFDDSKTTDGERASREVARWARQKHAVNIGFAGRKQRAAYADRLCEYTGKDFSVLSDALLVADGYTLGQNRNALLLDAAGVSCFCADDDTVCTPLWPPLIEDGIRASSEEDPCEYWCVADREEIFDLACPFEGDVLTAHESLLGKAVPGLESGPVPQVSLAAETLSRAVTHRVRVTFNGLAGDCGWGSPFGLWHAPMGYLALGGASLQRLIGSQETYQRAILSRQLLRATTSEVLADFAFSMLTFCGLDTREMLPPNPPQQRGQDLVFGQIMSRCFSEAVSGHIPVALGHEPVSPRRFWPGEMARSAAGVDLCRLMLEAVSACEFHSREITAGQRLRALGDHLIRIGRLPGESLAVFFQHRLHDSNRRFAQNVIARSERFPMATGYVADVKRYFDKLRAAEMRDDYWIPLDLWSIEGAVGAMRRLRENLVGFGRLLDAWPEIFDAAQALRREGVRLSVPV